MASPESIGNKPGEGSKQARLAGAVRAAEVDDLALGDVESTLR